MLGAPHGAVMHSTTRVAQGHVLQGQRAGPVAEQHGLTAQVQEPIGESKRYVEPVVLPRTIRVLFPYSGTTHSRRAIIKNKEVRCRCRMGLPWQLALTHALHALPCCASIVPRAAPTSGSPRSPPPSPSVLRPRTQAPLRYPAMQPAPSIQQKTFETHRPLLHSICASPRCSTGHALHFSSSSRRPNKARHATRLTTTVPTKHSSTPYHIMSNLP